MGHEVILGGFYSRFFFSLQENDANRQFSLPTASLVCCSLSTPLRRFISSEIESSKIINKHERKPFFTKLSRFHYVFIYYRFTPLHCKQIMR